MHGEAEQTAGGALVPPTSSSESLANPFLTGGTGLHDHSDRDPFGRSAGLWAGVSGLVLALVLGVALVALNPAITNGKAGGTPNQLGQPAAAAAGPAVQPGTPAFDGAQLIPTKQCPSCHTIPGIQGATGTVGPNLDTLKPDYRAVTAQVTNGGGAMPAFKSRFSAQQIADLAAYLVSLRGP